MQWFDHMGEQKGWIKREDMEGKLPLVESLGFLVEESEEFLLISHSVGVDEDEYFDAFYIMKNAIKMRKWVR